MRSRMVPAPMEPSRAMVKTQHQEEERMMSDPRPEHTPKPDEIDPDEGTEPDGTPVENPSGRWSVPFADRLIAA